ncbi:MULTISPECIES: outer membrane protein [unclassified Mesorhizobium]|uniref:outer membrane protein n=1 Tax=unclassified Mesorhizobium TaxID=325217 RepID=UPI00112CD22C|nr:MULTISPECIES: outer membrane protein [unclassified Mesorhizobium]MBZ9743312.1 porin family protein [Mesorhizobium sp. CO1-1-4]MBZ9803898.1 porin family protein [Mesorhizobium sp. ES1-6]TPL95502.1 porin family protein [Mesorhizobium sp. B2-3-12]
MRALKLALLASLVIATPALAADLSPQPTEPVAYDWTGVYVGAEAGYVWGSSTYDSAGSPAGPPYTSASLNPKGAFGGAYVGYNYQFDGNYVIGVEADANFASAKADNTFSGFPPPAFASSDLKWFGSARLRAGYAFDRFLPFVTGGLAIGKYSAGTSLSPFLGSPPSEISDTMVGWTAGAGLEYAVTDNLIARVEYRYSDYGRQSQSTPFIFTTQAARVDLTTNDVRVGLSYKF